MDQQGESSIVREGSTSLRTPAASQATQLSPAKRGGAATWHNQQDSIIHSVASGVHPAPNLPGTIVFSLSTRT